MSREQDAKCPHCGGNLEEWVGAWIDPKVLSMNFNANHGEPFDATIETPLVRLMAEQVAELFVKNENRLGITVENYLEQTYTFSMNDGSGRAKIYIGVVKPGGKTPHELRREADAALAALDKEQADGQG